MATALSSSFAHSLMHSFIHSLTHSLANSLIHPIIQSFICSLNNSFIQLFIQLLIWFVQSFIHSFIHQFIRLLIHAQMKSFTHSHTTSLIHDIWLIQSPWPSQQMRTAFKHRQKSKTHKLTHIHTWKQKSNFLHDQLCRWGWTTVASFGSGPKQSMRNILTYLCSQEIIALNNRGSIEQLRLLERLWLCLGDSHFCPVHMLRKWQL
jgi:hypothetical protein